MNPIISYIEERVEELTEEMKVDDEWWTDQKARISELQAVLNKIKETSWN